MVNVKDIKTKYGLITNIINIIIIKIVAKNIGKYLLSTFFILNKVTKTEFNI